MPEEKSQPRSILKSDFFRSLICWSLLVGSLILLADFEGVSSWLLKKCFGVEFIKYKVEAVTEDGKIICLAVVKRPDKDDKIKNATIRVRKIENKEETVKIEKKGISWLFR